MASGTTPSYPVYKWHTFFGGDQNSGANLPATAVDAAGNLYVTGATQYPWDASGSPISTTPLPAHQAYLAKINPAGQLLWTQFFYGVDVARPWLPGDIVPIAITLDSAGDIYIAGGGLVDPEGCSDCNSFVIEMDPGGSKIWGANFGGPYVYASTKVQGITYNPADDSVYITGGNYGDWHGGFGTLVTDPPGGEKMFILQVRGGPAPAMGWVGFYAVPVFVSGDVYGQAITVDSSSNLLVAGIDNDHLAVWKVSHAGQQAWENTYGLGRSYAAATDGTNVYVTGFSPQPWNGPATQLPLNAFIYGIGYAGDAFVLKLDAGGNYAWHTFYHAYGAAKGEGIAVDGPNTVYVAGTGGLVGYNDAPPQNNGLAHFILQLDNNGAYQWHSLYGVNGWDEASSVAVDSQHNVFVSGWSGYGSWNGDNDTLPLNPSNGAASEVFVMKFGPAAKATPVITWSNPADIVFGTALGSTQLNATASAPGTFVYTPSAGTLLQAGTSQTLSTTFTPTDTTDYTTATNSVLINVSKATPVITWAAPAPITYGSALGNGQLNASASVVGTFVYTPPAGTVLLVGNGQTLSVTFTPSDTVDYTTAPASTTINVNPAPPPPSGVNLVVTKVLSRTGGNVVVQLTIANAGGTAANNVTLTSVKVGVVSATPLPQTIGTIGPSASAQAIVSVPGSVGVSGAASSLTAAGTYTGGTFSLSMRITLP
ncbi:MAG: hypothetical protein ABSF62_10645 [Bryobacteraceae bacterium]